MLVVMVSVCHHRDSLIMLILSGVGISVYVTVLIRSVLNISVLVWVSRSLYDIFTQLDTVTGVASVQDLAQLQHQTPTSESLFSLEYSQLITLAVIIVIILVLSIGGVRVLGHVSILSNVAAMLLLLTLTIRCCLTVTGGQGVR